jgi:hypothetical protein
MGDVESRVFAKDEAVGLQWRGEPVQGVVVRHKRDGLVTVELDEAHGSQWVDCPPERLRREGEEESNG